MIGSLVGPGSLRGSGFALCLCLLPACGFAPEEPRTRVHGDYTHTSRLIGRLIDAKMAEQDIVGLSIALVDDQEIVWAQGFGWADRELGTKATPHTVYRAGSITKLFTATAVMQLKERGKLDIDQPLQRFLPGFSIKRRFKEAAVTPRNIMTHHSGLPSDYLHGMWSPNPDPFTELVEKIKDDYAAYPPDTVFSYSNLAMTLLGHAVQEVSGRPYSEYVKASLLEPIGMSSSYIAPDLRAARSSSKGYFKQEEKRMIALRDLPAGGLNSNVLDLARFAQMVLSDGRVGQAQILRPETLSEMLKHQDGDAPFDVQRTMGLAWHLDDRFGNEAGLIAGHDGATFLFSSNLMVLPENKLAVVVLANSAPAGEAVTHIARETLRLALETKTGISVPEGREAPNPIQASKAADLHALPGYYATLFGPVKIRRVGDRPIVESDDGVLNLVRREDGYYRVQYKWLGLLPLDLGKLGRLGVGHARVADRDLLIGVIDGRKLILGERVAAAPIPTAWRNRAGEYQVVNPQDGLVLSNVKLRAGHGDLLLEFMLRVPHLSRQEDRETLVLRAVGEEQAVILGLGRGKGETIRVLRKNDEEFLSYSGFLLRRIQ